MDNHGVLLKENRVINDKKYPGPHTCLVTGASQDHPRLDSNMITHIILPMVKNNP